MKVAARRIDIQYEAQFRRPAFTLAGNIGPLLGSLYDALSQPAGVRTEDLFAVASQRMSELACRVVLPRFNGSIEISVDKISATFRQLTGSDHINLVKQIIGTTETIISELLEGNFAAWSIGFHCWLHSREGVIGVKEMLERSGGVRVDLRAIGATTHDTSLKGYLGNPDEKWAAVYIFEPSALPEADLYASIQVNRADVPTSEAIEARALLVERILDGLFTQLGLEIDRTSGDSHVVH